MAYETASPPSAPNERRGSDLPMRDAPPSRGRWDRGRSPSIAHDRFKTSNADDVSEKKRRAVSPSEDDRDSQRPRRRSRSRSREKKRSGKAESSGDSAPDDLALPTQRRSSSRERHRRRSSSRDRRRRDDRDGDRVRDRDDKDRLPVRETPRDRKTDRVRDTSRDRRKNRDRDASRDRKPRRSSPDRKRDRERDRSREPHRHHRRHRSRSPNQHHSRDLSRDRRREHHHFARDRSRSRRLSTDRHSRRSASPASHNRHKHKKRRSRSPSPPRRHRRSSLSPTPNKSKQRRRISRSRSASSSKPSRSRHALPPQEVSFRGTDNAAQPPTKYGGAPPNIEKPNFAPTGLLAREANLVSGTKIALKYHEPSEARKPPASQEWKLFIFKGADSLGSVDLHTRSCWLLGREEAVADIVLAHPSCSGQHAAIQFRYIVQKEKMEDEFGIRSEKVKGRVRPYIIDLESSNGTVLNGERMESGRYVELRDKDLLQFAGSEREYVVVLPPAEK